MTLASHERVKRVRCRLVDSPEVPIEQSRSPVSTLAFGTLAEALTVMVMRCVPAGRAFTLCTLPAWTVGWVPSLPPVTVA